MSILNKIKSILHEKRYHLFSRPYELNIVGIRANNTASNRFDDEIHVFYRTSLLAWNYHVYQATTDPGTFWLNNPMNPQGTAILAQGQYLNAYQLGLHKGQYTALVQAKPVTVIRDYDRNAVLDFNNGSHATGIFGINIHRAMIEGTTKVVDKFSAGCQVFANAEDFVQFIALCQNHSKLYGNSFSYTLIDFRAIKRLTMLRRVFMGAAALGAGLIGYFNLGSKKKKRKRK